jgi:hypothetical protein
LILVRVGAVFVPVNVGRESECFCLANVGLDLESRIEVGLSSGIA